MTTLRSKLIHLAHARPEVRPHVLPLLKTAKKIDVSDDKIRKAYYKVGDGIEGLDEALSREDATKADQALKAAVVDLREAFDKVHKALDRYDWD